jgi:PAS domain S-box-containing protein
VFLQFDERDAEILRDVCGQLSELRSRYIDRFYDHLLSFPETRTFLEEPGTLERLKKLQARYFDTLLTGPYDTGYAEDRYRIGLTHFRVGLEPKWYFGAYAFYLRLLIPEIWRLVGLISPSRALATIEALLKAVFLDISLAVDAYRDGDKQRILQLLSHETALESELATQAAALQAVADPVIITDAEGVILWVNQAFTRQNGYSREEVAGKTPRILKSGLTDPSVYTALWSTILSGAEFRGEVMNRRKDGTTYVAELTVAPVLDATGRPTHFVSTHRDVTEQRNMQARMMQIDRIVAVGTLAAGVAHEINNPLTYVIANLDQALEELQDLLGSTLGLPVSDGGRTAADGPEPPPELRRRLKGLRDVLDEAKEGAQRVRHIVRDLRIFARAEEEARTLCDVRQATSPVLANEARLGGVFLNLLVNAVQAIPEGRAEENEIRIGTGMEKDTVVVEVRDTGCGIAPEFRSRIFDPFFTTKPPGTGTGLGLSICQSIVGALGGEITVESEVGKGTTFRVLLPAAEVELSAEPEPARSEIASGRRGRILVVDDDEPVRASVCRILRGEHDVFAVASAREALERVRQGGHFDVILCDVMMPEMSGMDLYAEMEQAFPEAARRIVFMTGGAFSPRAREFLERVGNPRIEKPFDVQELRAMVRQMVG